MTAEEAMKDLQDRVDGEFCPKGKNHCKDMKLGIEALKDVIKSRGTLRPGLYPLLPGETKD